MKDIEIIKVKDYTMENKIIKKYRYGEHPNCDICIAKEGCKINPDLYGCALTEGGEWIGFIK